MMVTADLELAISFVDARLDSMTGRSLIATTEVVDLLLDLRALLVAIDQIGKSHHV